MTTQVSSAQRRPAHGPDQADAHLRRAVADRIASDVELAAAPHDRARMRRAVARALAAEGVVVSPARWAALVRQLVDELGGLGPLEPLLRDPAVTDVMVNGADEIYVERGDRLVRVDAGFADDDAVVAAVRRVLGPLGARLDPAKPWADATLPDGIRLHALLPPVVPRPAVTLRRVAPVIPTWEELAAADAVPVPAATILRGAVADRRNIVVCGPAGAGKTTLLARMLGDVGTDRVVVIEDTPELRRPAPHTVHLRTRAPSPDGTGAIDLRALVRNALRMRPDRLVVGEVRGEEVSDMLQALNTGHHGMSTVHANGTHDALVRLHGMALLAGVPGPAASSQLGSALDVIAAVDRDGDGRRRLREIAEVRATHDGPDVQTIWERDA